MTAPRLRRALTGVGGSIETSGREADPLAAALDVPAAPAPDLDRRGARADDPDRAHVHGFHTYPARMHPVTARRLVEAFAPPGATVLDPFCGSGTVPVEALLTGRAALGTDLNPLAVQLARAKVRVRSLSDLTGLAEDARLVAAEAEARRKARAGATRKLPAEDVALFEPHVLLELDSLRAGLERLPREHRRADLFLVLSAILVKVSRKRGDTSEATEGRRIAAGYTTKLFVKKAEELVARSRAFLAQMPRPAPTAAIALDDATTLATVATASVDVVVTSPPYVATYDYLAHHALRLRWLGLDARAFEQGEVGSRRRFGPQSPVAARQQWADEVGAFLAAAARVTRPGGAIVLLMADSAVGREALRADEVVAAVARALPLRAVARASQPRAHFHGPTARAFEREPRREHALLLRRQ